MWRWILVPVGIVLVLSASVSITWAGIWAPVSEEFIAQLRTQLREAIAAADTLLLTVPNQLGVDYNAHVIDSILTHVAPALGWR